MAESAIQKLARLFQSIRDLETELGTGALSKSEKTLFTGIADISKNKKEGITIEDIMAHCETESMPVPTIYKCLRDLQQKGLLVRGGPPRASTYKIV